jgi:bifunctional DNA-binding transcriptional regulator/antitoxin component of YhaV-PrlF toxin-antitoxin module
MVARSIELLLDDDGRVTIPLDAQRQLGIGPGDVVQLVVPDRVDNDAEHKHNRFLKHAGTLKPLIELGDDANLRAVIRDVMEDAAIRRYRRSL